MEDNSSSVALDTARDAKSQLLPSEVLSRAADLIEPEGAWTQTVLARDAAGCEVPPLDVEAVCWCAAGAIARARGTDAHPYENDFVERVERIVPREFRSQQIWEWNDGRADNRRNQLRVVSALRKAADLARSEGQ